MEKNTIDTLNFCIDQIDKVKDRLTKVQMSEFDGADQEIGTKIHQLKTAIDGILEIKEGLLKR